MSSGWKSFEELQEKLSPAEVKFEKARRTTGLWLGPLVFVILLLLPLASEGGLSYIAQKVIAILAWTVIWWVCEPIPIPAASLIPIVLLPMMGVLPANSVFAVLGHQNNLLMIGTYIFIGALVHQGFTKRLALGMLNSRFATKSPFTLLLFFVGGVAILSTFLSNIPCTMLFLVIASGIANALHIDESHPYVKALKFGAAYGSQAGGVATPIGNPNCNFLVMGLILSLAEYKIRFVDFVFVGLPFGIIMFVITCVYFKGIFKLKLDDLENARAYAKEELEKLGPMSRGEKNGIFLAVFAIVLWAVPSVAAMIWGNNSPVTEYLDTVLNGALVALLAALLSFLIPTDWKERKFTMNWTVAERSINWGAIFIVTAGFVIGNAMNAEGVGLTALLAKSMAALFEGAPHILIVLGFVIFATVATQFISNVTATAIITTISIPVAIGTGMNPVAMAFCIVMAAQMSYVLPMAAPQMALAYGSGGIKITEFIKVGSILSLISIPVVTIFVYYWANLLFPYLSKIN